MAATKETGWIRPVTHNEAKVCNFLLCVVCAASGFLFEDPRLYFTCMAKAFVILLFGALGTAAIFQLIARSVGTLIQTSPNAQPARIGDEIKDTVFGFAWIISTMAAWPMARAALGYETALRGDLADCAPGGSAVLYMLKAIIGLLVSDAYNYWKHRLFHHRYIWAFHKTHHSHHNPTALGGFAICPAYGFATFWPVYLFCLPSLGLYLPLHWPILVFYGLLNHYLHCGYVIKPLEKLMSPFYVMTSGWHNVHHEKGRMGYNYKPQTFGEMFTIWDILMGTHADDHYLYSGSKKPN